MGYVMLRNVMIGFAKLKGDHIIMFDVGNANGKPIT